MWVSHNRRETALAGDYRDLMAPALEIIERAGGELDLNELLDALSTRLPASYGGQDCSSLNLSNDLRWALSYLTVEGKIELSADGQSINTARPAGFSEAASPWQPGSVMAAGQDDGSTHETDNLERLVRQAQRRLRRELLGNIHAREPQFFEQLILDLLIAIGYARAGDRASQARRIGGRADGGVDGVIYQDELGLDYFYIQAKRYKPSTTVPIAEVRDFAGSLEAYKAPKGVFVTTAFLPKSAYRFVEAIPRRITLIDGDGLASLMIRHNIGVKPEPLFSLKELDIAYFRT